MISTAPAIGRVVGPLLQRADLLVGLKNRFVHHIEYFMDLHNLALRDAYRGAKAQDGSFWLEKLELKYLPHDL